MTWNKATFTKRHGEKTDYSKYVLYIKICLDYETFFWFVFLNRSKYFHYCSINRPESIIRSIQPFEYHHLFKKTIIKGHPKLREGKQNFFSMSYLHGSHCDWPPPCLLLHGTRKVIEIRKEKESYHVLLESDL